MEPEGELVQRERGADAVEQRRDAAEAVRGLGGSRADLDQPQVTDQEQQPDPPNVVMEMDARDPQLEGTIVGPEPVHQQAGGPEGEKEAERREHHALAAVVAEVVAIKSENAGPSHGTAPFRARIEGPPA